MKSQFLCILGIIILHQHWISYHSIILAKQIAWVWEKISQIRSRRNQTKFTDFVNSINNYCFMEQAQSKLSISFKPPLPSIRVLPSPRSPAIPHSPNSLPIKRTSTSKSIVRTSVEKSGKEKQIQKEIKYTKNIKPEAKNEVSFIQSQSNTLVTHTNRNQLEESQATVQKVKSISREKRDGSNWKRGQSIERDTLSGMSQTNRKGSAQKNEQFYLYWKNKAHEYLESNIKFMDQISKLNKQNQDLNEEIRKMKAKTAQLSDSKQQKVHHDNSALDIRAMSMHYLKKIEQMQKELKRKEIIIISYEIKLKELNQTIVGENQRIKIISSLKDQIFKLREENNKLLKPNKDYKIVNEQWTKQKKCQIQANHIRHIK